MKDYYKIPVHVEGCRTEYGSGKHRLIIDACQLSPDLYEVIAMRPTGAEIHGDSKHARAYLAAVELAKIQVDISAAGDVVLIP
jgi:hypothetical protein